MTTLAKEVKKTMEKLDPKKDGASPDVVAENLERMRELFPEVFAEGKVDFEALRETLGEYVEDKQERYSFTWHGKGGLAGSRRRLRRARYFHVPTSRWTGTRPRTYSSRATTSRY